MWNLNQKKERIDEEESEKSEYEFVLMDDRSRSTLSLQDDEDKHHDDGDDDNDSLMHEDHGMQEEEEEEEDEDSIALSGCGSIAVTLSNPNMLDCYLCLESLSAPVFQCQNGHMVCSSCCSHHRSKCYQCSPTVSYNRCKAIEKLLGSMKISCFNAEYGCKETLSCLKRNDHEKKCIYGACVCPISGCDLFASTMELSLHVSHKHGDSVQTFQYDHTFIVFLNSQDETIVLQEKIHGNLFLLKSNVVPLGNAVDISCIAPNSYKVHEYQILTRSHGSNLKLESFAKNICFISLDPPSSGFIFIPRDYFGSSSSGILKVGINIRH